jgi:hypothetical protein
MPPRRPEHLDRRQMEAFDPEKHAGPGKSRLPCDFKPGAFDTIRRVAWGLGAHGPIIARRGVDLQFNMPNYSLQAFPLWSIV